MNRYPIWKYALVTLVAALAGVYATPNVYPDDVAVQISHSSGVIPDGLADKITRILEKNEVAIKRIEAGEEQILVRLHNSDAQLRAADILKRDLSDRHVVALNLAPTTPDWLREINAGPMNLGLDLRGGVYFLLEVDARAAWRKSLERYRNDLRNSLRRAKLRYRRVDLQGEKITVTTGERGNMEGIQDHISREYWDVFEVEEKEQSGRTFLVLTIPQQRRLQIIGLSVQQNIATLRRRVNELGVAEPVITRQGADRIAVQLPGVQDTARAKEILGATAILEFRLVAEGSNATRAHRTGRAPSGTKLYYERGGQPVLLKRAVMLTGEHITDASAGIDSETAQPAVHISLDGDGAARFADVTGKNVKRLMAVVYIENKTETVLDKEGKPVKKTRTIEEVISVARIQEQLSNRFQITGLDSPREAQRLALLLRAGSLAAPMEIVEERTIGPSLGKANIDKGVESIILGFILVMVFMGVYYRVFGLFANSALILNILLIIAVMSAIPGATLTLPGIVGIVLTIGMAVDANVLIFERIRQELHAGNSTQASIDSGYRRALTTIADANITTLIAALVLFVFGTGPIKGFSVTLSIGVLCSMFTAIMGTRALVNLFYGNRTGVKLPI